MRDITRTILQFLLGLAAVIVVSAFLAPWVYQILPFFKFDRILRRLIMIGALVLVAGLIRSRRENPGRLGLEWRKESSRLLGVGFCSGAIVVLVVTLGQWALGARLWQLYETDWGRWIGFFFKSLGAGILIGAIEEFFFRGFLFITFKDLWNTKGSLVATNLIYSLVHFFPKGKVPVDATPTFIDSFRILNAFGSSWGDPQKILPLLGLFFFGLLLSFTFLRAQSLFLPIGIHAGAIFGLKMNRRFFPEISEKMGMLSGSKQLYDGLLGIFIFFLLCVWFRPKERIQRS